MINTPTYPYIYPISSIYHQFIRSLAPGINKKWSQPGTDLMGTPCQRLNMQQDQLAARTLDEAVEAVASDQILLSANPYHVHYDKDHD